MHVGEEILNVPVAILAGGLATRLRPVTQHMPKAIVPVAGRPFVFHQLELLARNGFLEAVFLIGFMGEKIVEAVGDGSAFGIKVRYMTDGPGLLGTGGAIARAVPQLGNSFAVLYGDSYLDFDYQAACRHFEKDGRPALMTVFRNEGRWDTSNVALLDGEVVAYSKIAPNPQMKHIDYGFSLFNSSAFASVPTDRATDLAVIFERLAASGNLSAFEVHQRFYEAGSFSGLQELEAYLSGASR